MLAQLLEKLRLRLNKKLNKAQEAYVRQNTSKETQNCHNRGRVLSEGVRVCKLGCMGEDEASAGQCWNEKAAACTEFQLRRSVDSLKAEFKGFSEEEIKLRWPSIGELMWMERETEKLIQIGLEKLNVTDTTETKAG